VTVIVIDPALMLLPPAARAADVLPEARYALVAGMKTAESPAADVASSTAAVAVATPAELTATGGPMSVSSAWNWTHPGGWAPFAAASVAASLAREPGAEFGDTVIVVTVVIRLAPCTSCRISADTPRPATAPTTAARVT